jgi:hypothetical protein
MGIEQTLLSTALMAENINLSSQRTARLGGMGMGHTTVGIARDVRSRAQREQRGAALCLLPSNRSLHDSRIRIHDGLGFRVWGLGFRFRSISA